MLLSILAAVAVAAGLVAARNLPALRVARIAAVAAHLHGRAGAVAADEGRSVAALDIVHALPEALASVRSG